MEIIRVAGAVNPFNGATSRSYVIEMPSISSQAFFQYGIAAAELDYKKGEKLLLETIKKNLKTVYGLDPDSDVIKGIDSDLLSLIREVEQARVTLQTSRSSLLALMARLGYDKYPSVPEIVFNGDFRCLVKDHSYEFDYRGKLLTIVFVSGNFPS